MQADTLSTNDDQTDHHGAQAPHQLDDQAPHRGDHPLHLTIAEYAEHVGLSQSTIRRKIRRGELAAELVEGPYGQEYRIWLGDQVVRRDQGGWSPPGAQGGHHGDQSDYQPAEGLGELVALLREKDQTILVLAGRCGFYQAEIQHLHAQLEDARA